MTYDLMNVGPVDCLFNGEISVEMDEADPQVLLEWLSIPGEMQIVALEQLCMMLLLSDNVDRVFEKYF